MGHLVERVLVGHILSGINVIESQSERQQRYQIELPALPPDRLSFGSLKLSTLYRLCFELPEGRMVHNASPCTETIAIISDFGVWTPGSNFQTCTYILRAFQFWLTDQQVPLPTQKNEREVGWLKLVGAAH